MTFTVLLAPPACSLLVTVEGLYSGTASPLAAVVVAAAGVVAGAAVVAGADVGLEELLPELQPTIHADNRRISEAGFQCAKDNHAVCMRRRCAAGRATVASAVGS